MKYSVSKIIALYKLGYSHKQIAAEVGATHQVVAVTLYRARKIGRISEKRGPMLGESNPSAKLTEADVREIHTAYRTGRFTLKQLGETYGVDHSHVWNILHGRTWKAIAAEFPALLTSGRNG